MSEAQQPLQTVSGTLENLLPLVGDYIQLLTRIGEMASSSFPAADSSFTARLHAGVNPLLQIAAMRGLDIKGTGMPDRFAPAALIDPWELHGAPLVINDLSDTPFKLADFLAQGQIRSLLALPLPGASSTSAVLVLGSREKGAFEHLTAEEIERFRHDLTLPLTVADQLSHQESLTETALQMSHTLWQAAHGETNYKLVLQLILSQALEISGADAGSLMASGAESEELFVRASSGVSDGDPATQLPWGARSAAPLWQSGSDIHITATASAEAPLFRKFAAANDFASYCGVPLHFADNQPALGLINLYWHAPQSELGLQTQRLLDSLAHTGAEILEYFRMSEVVETDKLVRTQLNEHKGLLNSLISHQLRTPLTSLKGFSQLMVRRANNGQPIGDTRHAQTMLTEANRLSVMLDNVLDLSRLERSLLEVERRPFDMQAFIDDLRNDSFVASLIENGALAWRVPAKMPDPIGDVLRLRQAVLALLRRARTRSDEMDNARITVQVSADNTETGLKVDLTIQSAEEAGDLDDGNPLSMIDLRNVIEQKAATQDELALYSAVLLVRAMGADLKVQASADNKVCYVVSLPAAEDGN